MSEPNKQDQVQPVHYLACTYCGCHFFNAGNLDDCPSCRKPVWHTLILEAKKNRDDTVCSPPGGEEWNARIKQASSESGHSELAVLLLLIFIERHRLKSTVLKQAGEGIDSPQHLWAIELVELIYSNFRELGHGRGYLWLIDLGLNRPQKIGLLVYAMVDAGLINASIEDRQEDFNEALLAVHWFENCRRLRCVKRWRNLPGGRLWVALWKRRWRWYDSELDARTRGLIEEHWARLVESEQ